MSIKPDKEVLEAMKKEGNLGKQGRSVLNKYYQRYWRIIDNGLTLGYAHDKQSFDQGKLSGKVALKDILTIIDEDKPKKFQLICEGRVYKLEADSPNDKKAWISALKKCMDYATKYSKEEQKDLLAIDDDIIFEESGDLDEKSTEKFNLLEPIGLLANTAKVVVFDATLNNAVKLVKTGVNAVSDVIIQRDKLASNEEFLVAKKLNQAFDRIDPKILKSRILMGYLYKETKETFGVGVVDDIFNDVGFKDTLKRQWFLMVSSKPIIFDQVDRDDEEILDAGRIPNVIDPEVLYAYDETCNSSAPLEEIPMKDVTDVTIKKKANREQFYRFILNLGKKKIYLITHNVMEMTTWVKAIQASRAIIKEQAKSKLPVVKNIYWLRRILDEQGDEDLMEKIEMDYERIVAKVEANKTGGVEGLIKTQKAVADELISVINACLVQKDQRLDIVKFYIGIFHENIILTFRNYFKKNDKNLDNKDCFEMINFLVWYRDLIRVFGAAFSDKRINDGIITLCQLVARRILRSNLEAVKNIINQELVTEPRVDGKGRLTSNAPLDIFRIVNESFQVVSYCACEEFAFAIMEIEKYTLFNFQEGLKNTLESYKLDVKKLAAFCNNTVTYIANVKAFIKGAEATDFIDSSKIPQYFDEGALNKGFADVSKKAYECIAEEQFSNLNSDWKNTFYLDIDLKTALATGLRNVQSVMDKIHSNYTSKVDLACLQKIVTSYIENFLQSAENKRFQKGDCSRVSSKLQEDEAFLRELFSKNLKSNVIEDMTNPLTKFHDFLNTNYAFLSLQVQSMKETYGDAIQWDALIRLRDDELEAQEQEELFQVCQERFDATQKKEDKALTFDPFRRVTQFDESVPSSRNNSLFGLFPDINKKENTNVTRSFVDQYLEGYLEADKDEFFSDFGGLILSNLKFERRYFTIRRDVLYYYKAKSSERAMGSYNLKEVTECTVSKDDPCAFYIELKTKARTMKKAFKAETPEKKNQWINAINEAKTLDNSNTLMEVQSTDLNLFKDTKQLFHEFEKMPDLRYGGPKKEKVIVKKEAPPPIQTTITPPPPKKVGCCEAFCRIFGFGSTEPEPKPKNNEDYMPINDETEAAL